MASDVFGGSWHVFGVNLVVWPTLCQSWSTHQLDPMSMKPPTWWVGGGFMELANFGQSWHVGGSRSRTRQPPTLAVPTKVGRSDQLWLEPPKLVVGGFRTWMANFGGSHQSWWVPPPTWGVGLVATWWVTATMGGYRMGDPMGTIREVGWSPQPSIRTHRTSMRVGVTCPKVHQF